MDPLRGIDLMLEEIRSQQSPTATAANTEWEPSCKPLSALQGLVRDQTCGVDDARYTPRFAQNSIANSESPRSEIEKPRKRKLPTSSKRKRLAGKRTSKLRQGERSMKRNENQSTSPLTSGAHFSRHHASVPKEHDVVGASSDDLENKKLLLQMKRLAEKQFDVNMRKQEVLNERAVNEMRTIADASSQNLRKLAGSLSKEIIQNAAKLTRGITTERSDYARATKSIAAIKKDSMVKMTADVRTCTQEIEEIVEQTQMQRKKHQLEHSDEQRKAFEYANWCCHSGQKLQGILAKIDDLLVFPSN